MQPLAELQSRRPVRRRGVMAVLGSLAALTTTMLTPDPAEARPPDTTHCVSPSGVDLNVIYDVPGRIVSGFCDYAFAGERFSPATGWFMSPAWDLTPPGFNPTGATPVEEFVARLDAVRFVIDAGTRQEKSVTFPSGPNLAVITGGPFVVANIVTLGRIGPLSVGNHTIDTYLILDGPTCDGLGDVFADNCLPAGTTWFDGYGVTVSPHR